MITLEELTQLVTFADEGNLSKAAQVLHISQPTITRTMQHLEEDFGVSMFSRTKNKITINDTGLQAVEYARKILSDTEQMVRSVRAYDKALRTITLEACAPAPIWTLLPILNQKFPSMTISSGISEIGHIIAHVRDGSCDIGVVLEPVEDNSIRCNEFLREDLRVCLPKGHPILDKNPETVSFSDIDGFNFLLRSNLGFWDELCRTKMPSSRFLVQQDEFEFNELIENSSLPIFSTNLADHTEESMKSRTEIPISDKEASVTYYLITRVESPYKI